MMCWDDVWTWQGIVGNNRRDLFTSSAFAPLTPAKLIHFLWFKLWKKIGRKLCQTHTYTMHLGTHSHLKANKWINTHIHTLTGNQYCSCRKIVNVKRQKWIMLMAWLTVVFNIMISNSRKIDYITSSLFTWWKKIYWPVVLKDKHKEKLQLWPEQEQDTSKLYVVLVRKSSRTNLFILKCSWPHQTKWYAFEVK